MTSGHLAQATGRIELSVSEMGNIIGGEDLGFNLNIVN